MSQSFHAVLCVLASFWIHFRVKLAATVARKWQGKTIKITSNNNWIHTVLILLYLLSCRHSIRAVHAFELLMYHYTNNFRVSPINWFTECLTADPSCSINCLSLSILESKDNTDFQFISTVILNCPVKHCTRQAGILLRTENVAYNEQIRPKK